MKIELSKKNVLFNETQLPDVFFSEYLNNMPGDYVKIYLYLIFLSKYSQEVKINNLSKNLSLPINVISDGIKYLEENQLILKKPDGYIIMDMQSMTLNKFYKPNVSITSEKVEENAKNQERIQLIQYINNTYFQGVMGLSWYDIIDMWLEKYKFDKQVLITLFDYCFKKSALTIPYIKTVADAWGANKIKNLGDLEHYYMRQDKLNKIKKSIAKKLGRKNGLTEYEETYIETWVNDFKYDMDIIEIALKRTTLKNNVSFEYLNNVLKDWNERNLRTPAQVTEHLEKRKQQNKDTKELTKKTKKANFEQREYKDLSFLYANKDMLKGEANG